MRWTERRRGLRAFSGMVGRSVTAAFAVVIAVLWWAEGSLLRTPTRATS